MNNWYNCLAAGVKRWQIGKMIFFILFALLLVCLSAILISYYRWSEVQKIGSAISDLAYSKTDSQFLVDYKKYLNRALLTLKWHKENFENLAQTLNLSSSIQLLVSFQLNLLFVCLSVINIYYHQICFAQYLDNKHMIRNGF